MSRSACWACWPPTACWTSAGPRACGSLDVRGAASAAAGFALLTLSLSLGQQWGWTSPRLVTCLALAVATLVAAVLIERQVPHPVVDLALLRERVFASALGSLTLSMLALFGVSFMLPFYFEELRGFSVERSAVMLTPLPLTIAVVAPLSGTLADRLGSRWLAAGGLAFGVPGPGFARPTGRNEHDRRDRRASGPDRHRPGPLPVSEHTRS